MCCKKNFLFMFTLVLSQIANAALPIYPSEIMGRDLEFQGLSKFGHVGITMAPNINQTAFQVIEALWEKPVIQTNYMSDFRSRTPYWGSRYGIISQNNGALRILREANFQKDLGCSTYTTTAAYYPSKGRYDSLGRAKATYCGKFRCDTFVNYLFHWGGHNLPNYSPPGEINSFTTPERVFEAFPYGNHDGPKSFSTRLVSANLAIDDISINTIDAQQLSNLPSEIFLRVVDVPSNKISESGVRNILTLFKNHSITSEKRTFLLDKLGFVGTADMIPDLINYYYDELNEQDFLIKDQMFATLQNIYQRTMELNETFIEQKFLQDFYLDVLSTKLYPTENDMALRGYITLSSEQEILSNLTTINSSLSGLKPSIALGLQLELISKSYSLEKIYLQQVLDMLSIEKDLELNGIFNFYIVNRLTASLSNAFDSEFKNKITNHLISLNFDYSSLSIKKEEDTGINMFSHGIWLEALALVTSNSYKEAANYINDFISRENTIEKQEKYVIGLSNSPYMKKAFSKEPALKNFKIQRGNIYLNTVGSEKFSPST